MFTTFPREDDRGVLSDPHLGPGALHDLLNDLSADPPDERAAALHPRQALQRVARFFNVERSLLYEVAADRLSLYDEARKLDEQVSKRWTHHANLARLLPWTWQQLAEGRKTVCVSSLDAIPEDAKDRGNYAKQGVRSLVLMPAAEAGARAGHVIGLQSTRCERAWTTQELASLQLIGARFSHELVRVRREIDMKASADFEHLLLRVSTLFAGARWNQVGAEVEQALKLMLPLCAVDEAAIFEVLPDTADACLRHAACAIAIPPFPEQLSYAEWFPWAFRKVVLEGETLAVGRVSDLPAEARADKASMRALGRRSLLHIPIRVESEVRFVLTAASSGRPPAWTPRCITRLMAIGEIFAHAVSRAEAVGALLATRNDVRDTLDVAHLGRWEWDIGPDRLRLSDEAKHILGADLPVFGRLLELVEPGDRARFERSIELAREQPGRRFRTHYTIRTSSGETRAIQQWHEVMFPGERTARLIATVQDVTALLQTEQEVKELRAHHWHSARVAQTTLLVASLAHELSQPLSAILNNAQAGLRFLTKGNLGIDDMRDILTDIVTSDKRATEVLGVLRSMLRRQHTTYAVFDAVDVVHDVLVLMRSELMTNRIDVSIALDPGHFLNADKIQIEQVLLNLVMNSADAMRDNPDGERNLEISVCGGPQGEVQFVVKDSGTGIPADKLTKVFEAFWTTKQQGLGMGLPMCRAIVESYGGRIWCESNEVGRVAFRVTLPNADEGERSAPRLHVEGRPAEVGSRHGLGVVYEPPR